MFRSQEAYSHVAKCCVHVRPNRGFVNQLSQFEKELHGQVMTDISDPNF